jgi:F1F0 ATPase subunit 2
MNATALAPVLGKMAVAVPAGLALGVAYFAALRRTTDLYAAGRGWTIPASLTLGRLVAAAGFFALAANFGAMPLLAVFSGFLIARGLALRAVKRAV